MAEEKAPAPEAKPTEPPAEQQVYIPKPPSPAETKEISEQQALITDEWSGEGPGGRG